MAALWLKVNLSLTEVHVQSDWGSFGDGRKEDPVFKQEYSSQLKIFNTMRPAFWWCRPAVCWSRPAFWWVGRHKCGESYYLLMDEDQVFLTPSPWYLQTSWRQGTQPTCSPAQKCSPYILNSIYDLENRICLSVSLLYRLVSPTWYQRKEEKYTRGGNYLG